MRRPKIRSFDASTRKQLGHWTMELLIVVIGVLLALWLARWAEDRSERARTEAALEAIHTEALVNLLVLARRESVRECFVQQIDNIRDRLLANDGDWPGIADDAIYLRRDRASDAADFLPTHDEAISLRAYMNAQESGALRALEDDAQLDYLSLYSMFGSAKQSIEEFEDAKQNLAALQYAGPLTPEIRFEALRSITTLDRSLDFQSRYYAILGPIEELGIRATGGFNDIYAAVPRRAEEGGELRECYRFPDNPLVTGPDATND